MINIKTLLVATILLISYQFYSVKAAEENKRYHKYKYNVEVFKTPSCGCCYGYVLFLEEEKFKVKQTDMRSLHTIKQKYNIPVEMQSCHTTIMGKYFIEGHVPFEAVEKLLKEQPDIDGIALPGMPIGTPGMPGDKDEPYVIYQLKDGKSSVFMTI